MESGTRQRARSLHRTPAACSITATRYREPSDRLELPAAGTPGDEVTIISKYTEADTVLPLSPNNETYGSAGPQMSVVRTRAQKYAPGRRYLGYSAEAFEAVDAHALVAPPAARASLGALATYLMQAPTRDRDLYKMRVIFRWMCHNLAHGGDSNYHHCSPPVVLATGVTSCVGFVNFLAQVAECCGMGDKVVTVEGFCKGRDYSIPFNIEEPNHAWVLVQLEGEWYLCDPTWAAGGYDSQGDFDRDFDDFWFLTPPELFAYSHFPQEKEMLLLPPTSRFDFSVFRSTPSLYSPFFRLGLRLGAAIQAVLPSDSDVLTLEWEATSTPPAILAKLYPWAAPTAALENCVLVQHGQARDSAARKMRFCVVLPKPGVYKLEVYAKPVGAEGTYKPLLWGYRLQRTGNAAPPPRGLPLRYPEVYEPYSTAGAWVMSPAAAYVALTHPTEWSVSLTGMADQVDTAIIRCHHRWAELKRDRSGRPFFAAAFAPFALPVEVLVTHKGDDKSVRTVLRYGPRSPPGTPAVYLSPKCATLGVVVEVDPQAVPSSLPPYNPQALSVRCNEHVQLALVLEDPSGLELEDRVLQLGPATNFRVKVTGPRPGPYTLKVFAALRDQPQSLGVCTLPLLLDVAHIGPPLVRQMGPCAILEPQPRQLRANVRTPFRLQVPGALVVVLVNAGRRLFFERGPDNLWTGDFSLLPCPCTMVGASTDPNDTSLAILLKYIVK